MFDKRTINENNDLPNLSRIKVISGSQQSHFEKFALESYSLLVESGISDWTGILMKSFLHQRMFYKMSMEGFYFENVGTFFTFANQIITGVKVDRALRSVSGNIDLGRYVGIQYFGIKDWFGKAFATNDDLIVAWVLFIFMSAFSILCFMIEMDLTIFNFINLKFK